VIKVSEARSGVVVVTIDRVARRNAIDLAGFRALAAAWRRLENDPQVRAVIVTGASGHFSSGADLAAFPAQLQMEVDAGNGADAWADINLGILRDARLRVPLIAAVEGICFGGGLELVGGTDIRIAGRSARFALPEVRNGVVPSGGSLARLTRQIPYAAAMQLVLTGAEHTAAEMHRIGYLNQVVDDGTALDAAVAVAQRIARNAPTAVRASKRVVRDSLDVDLNGAYELESQIAREVLAGPEYAAGVRAFLDKRPAPWLLD
jgi:enoyl-CoA hydratase